jgi:hypothetical protein
VHHKKLILNYFATKMLDKLCYNEELARTSLQNELPFAWAIVDSKHFAEMCSTCGMRGGGRKFRKCSRCRRLHYCNESCQVSRVALRHTRTHAQRLDWAQHKLECGLWTFVSSPSNTLTSTPDELLNLYTRFTVRVCTALACDTPEGIGLNGSAAARTRVVHMVDRKCSNTLDVPSDAISKIEILRVEILALASFFLRCKNKISTLKTGQKRRIFYVFRFWISHKCPEIAGKDY